MPNPLDKIEKNFYLGSWRERLKINNKENRHL